MPGKTPVPFLTAAWRHVVMLNYEVDPAALDAYVPRGTELDLWEGKAYVSVVGFVFLNTRVVGVRVPFHQGFEEVNLRFYVRHRAEDGWRRGVSFIKELVPRRVVAFVARTVYNEPYEAVPMSHSVSPVLDGGGEPIGLEASYSWVHAGNAARVEIETAGMPEAMIAGTAEEFIAEHYWGYTKMRDGGTAEYKVEHPRWNVARAKSARFEGDVSGVYGETFAGYLRGEPASAFLVDGSEVAVYRGRRLEG